MKDYNKEIKELEDKIKKLTIERDHKLSMPQEQRLAELIHDAECHWNHTDGCGWYYEKWDDPGYSKKKYLGKARAILKEVSFETAMKVVKHL